MTYLRCPDPGAIGMACRFGARKNTGADRHGDGVGDTAAAIGTLGCREGVI